MKRNTPLVSWLLCAHLVDEKLRLAIESCLDQTFRDFELIIVCNGPQREDLEEVIKIWFPGNNLIRIIKTEIRQLTFSLNLGLHNASGMYIARMDADDLATKDRIQTQVDFLNANLDIMVVGTWMEFIDDNGIPLKKVKLPTTDSSISRSLFFGNPIVHSSVMYRKDAIVNIGGYLGGVYAQDYDLWLRLKTQYNCKFANLPHVGVFYRKKGVGKARKSIFSYAEVSGSQFRNWTAGCGVLWLVASFYTFLKSRLLSSSN